MIHFENNFYECNRKGLCKFFFFFLFTGCCQEKMNSVFEISTNIGCGWGSLLWKTEFFLFAGLKLSSTKAVPNPVLSTVLLMHQMLDSFPVPSANIQAFCTAALSPLLLGLENSWLWNTRRISVSPPSPAQRNILRLRILSEVAMCKMCFQWRP